MNNLIDIKLVEVNSDGDIRYNLVDMNDGVSGYSFYPSDEARLWEGDWYFLFPTGISNSRITNKIMGSLEEGGKKGWGLGTKLN